MSLGRLSKTSGACSAILDSREGRVVVVKEVNASQVVSQRDRYSKMQGLAGLNMKGADLSHRKGAEDVAELRGSD